jgi:hypothetical protein
MERLKEKITMSFSPQAFLSHIQENNGIATGNRYEVKIDSPLGSPILGLKSEKVSMLCHTAKILGKTINANSQIYGFGSEYNLPINEGFEDLSLSFHTTFGKDPDGYGLPEKKFFDDWINLVINPNTNESGFKNEYAANINVHLLDSTGKSCYHQQFIKAIPLTISDLELSSAGTELLSFDVTFTYDNWLSNDRIDWPKKKQ